MPGHKQVFFFMLILPRIALETCQTLTVDTAQGKNCHPLFANSDL